MTNASTMPRATRTAHKTNNQRSLLSKGMRLFVSPEPAGRKITAGFSLIQRIGKSANVDVWFPESFRQELNAKIAEGLRLSPQDFPAEWAAVRQFELLQEAGNYKIFDLTSEHLTRSLVDVTRNMRGGGYRVTIASIGSYQPPGEADDLEILDRRLQDRISALTHMLYMEEESENINAAMDVKLKQETWDYRTELPHVGVTLGARHLFRPVKLGNKISAADQRHKHAMHFFDILSQLPQRHIVHDTAVGLQLPDSINEHEWIYCAQGEDTLQAFNSLLKDLFTPFDKGKASVQHMQGYGDRLNVGADQHYSSLAKFALQ